VELLHLQQDKILAGVMAYSKVRPTRVGQRPIL